MFPLRGSHFHRKVPRVRDYFTVMGISALRSALWSAARRFVSTSRIGMYASLPCTRRLRAPGTSTLSQPALRLATAAFPIEPGVAGCLEHHHDSIGIKCARLADLLSGMDTPLRSESRVATRTALIPMGNVPGPLTLKVYSVNL
jgi:hypothetical protein